MLFIREECGSVKFLFGSSLKTRNVKKFNRELPQNNTKFAGLLIYFVRLRNTKLNFEKGDTKSLTEKLWTLFFLAIRNAESLRRTRRADKSGEDDDCQNVWNNLNKLRRNAFAQFRALYLDGNGFGKAEEKTRE